MQPPPRRHTPWYGNPDHHALISFLPHPLTCFVCFFSPLCFFFRSLSFLLKMAIFTFEGDRICIYFLIILKHGQYPFKSYLYFITRIHERETKSEMIIRLIIAVVDFWGFGNHLTPTMLHGCGCHMI